MRRGYNGNFLRQWLYPGNHWRMSFGRTSGHFLTRWPEARHLKHLPSFISCALSKSVNFLRRVRVAGRNFGCISLDSVGVPAIVSPVETRAVLAAIRFDPRLVLNNCKFMRATRAARMASDNVRGCSRITSEFRWFDSPRVKSKARERSSRSGIPRLNRVNSETYSSNDIESLWPTENRARRNSSSASAGPKVSASWLQRNPMRKVMASFKTGKQPKASVTVQKRHGIIHFVRTLTHSVSTKRKLHRKNPFFKLVGRTRKKFGVSYKGTVFRHSRCM